MSVDIFNHEFVVQKEHIDALGHVNNVVYVQWVQDAAEAHWLAKAPPSVRTNFNWVVLRHEIDYRSAAYVGDALIATTWVDHYDGAKSTRVVKISRAKDSKTLCEARTTWCLLNGQSGRPVRVTDEVKQIFIPLF